MFKSILKIALPILVCVTGLMAQNQNNHWFFGEEAGIEEEFDMHRRSERTGVITNEMDGLA